jgi:hypothetical protein
MKPHTQTVAILNIAAGALYLLIAAAVFLFMGMAAGIVVSQGEHQAAGIIGIVTVALTCFIGVIGLPSVIGGWALYTGKSWGRPVVLVLAVLHLPNVPLGTALGIYSLWALLIEEPRAQLAPPAPQSIV